MDAMAEPHTSIFGSGSAAEPQALPPTDTTDMVTPPTTMPAPPAHPTLGAGNHPSHDPGQGITCERALMLKNTTELTTIDPMGDLYLQVGVVICQLLFDVENGGHRHSRAEEFRVDSRALSRISPVFMKMLNGPFAESNKPGEDQKWRVALPDDNVKAMGTLLNIMHCQFGNLPAVTGASGLEDLYQIAVLTDKYDCTALVRPWATSWLAAASALVPNAFTNDLEKISWVAWEYGDKTLFKRATRSLIIQLNKKTPFAFFFWTTLEPKGLKGM